MTLVNTLAYSLEMTKKKDRNLKELAAEIREYLEDLRRDEGWTMDDLANYLEINSMSLRNSYYKEFWSDLMVTIIKLKSAIPPDLAFEYKRALERERIQKRKGKKGGKHDPNENRTRALR